jgi:hypothetical protein
MFSPQSVFSTRDSRNLPLKKDAGVADMKPKQHHLVELEPHHLVESEQLHLAESEPQHLVEPGGIIW